MARRYTAEEDTIILNNVCLDAIELSLELVLKMLPPDRTLTGVITRHKSLRGIVAKKSPGAVKRCNEIKKAKNDLLRQSSPTNNYKSWKTSEVNFIKSNTMSRLEQAKYLGRSYDSVCNMFKRINKQEAAQ